MRHFISLTILFFSIFTSLFAQTDTVSIEEVVIRKNRFIVPLAQKPSGAVLVDSVKINHTAVQSVADLMHYVPGVDMKQRGSNGIQSDISIRGSSFDQVLVLINGIKINDPQTGHFSFNLPVDISNIDNIEVYKGSSARVFGQNAFAGAVNIVTKNPDKNFVKSQISSGGYGLLGANVSYSEAGKKMKNYISLGHSRSDGYRYNTDYKISDIFYQSEINTDYGKINLLSGLNSRKFGANGFYSGPEYTDQYEEVMTSFAAISYSPMIKNNNLKLTANVNWRRSRDEYIFIRNNPSYYRNLHVNNVIGTDIDFRFRSTLGITDIKLNLCLPWLTSSRLGNRNRKEISLLTEHRFVLFNEKLNITPGIQFNFISDFNSKILPGIDFGYSLSQSLLLFVNSGLTYRIPNFTDLYYEDPSNSSNPYLKPEYAFSNEAGLKTVNTNGFSGQVSYFIRDNYDLIDRTKESSDDKWFPENIGKVRMSGIDLSLSVYPGKLTGNDAFFIKNSTIGYTYINSKINYQMPAFSKFSLDNLRNQITMETEFRYLKSLFQTVSLRYTDRVNMDDYFIADTRAGLSFNKFSFYVDITNIFNTEYKETNFVPMPGRWIKAGISAMLHLK
jgi:vitamin B12 transporter